MRGQLQEFTAMWDRETQSTLALLGALPIEQYDLRAEPGGRSIGELAWHLAEIEAYVSTGVQLGDFKFALKPLHLDRPRRVEELAPAFQIVHNEAAVRLSGLQDADLDREILHVDGVLWTIRDLLWRRLLLHAAHHRGQLMMLCRVAGGVPPAVFGRTREQTPARVDATR